MTEREASSSESLRLAIVVVVTAIAFGGGMLVYRFSHTPAEKPAPTSAGGAPDGQQNPGGNPGQQNNQAYQSNTRVGPFPKATQFPEKQAFSWDFSRERDCIYDYGIKTKTTYPGRTEEQHGVGGLTVKARGNGTADLVLSDFVLDSAPGTMGAPTIVREFTEDSRMPPGGSPTDMLDEFSFLLPPKPMRIGKPALVPIRKSFTAGGRPVWLGGFTMITLKDYVLIDGHLCAKLEFVTDISQSEVFGSYEVSLKGTGLIYFDTEERSFFYSEYSPLVTVLLKVETETPDGKRHIEMKLQSKVDRVIRFVRNKMKEKDSQENQSDEN